MDYPPPLPVSESPESSEPPSFKLPLLVWILWGIYAAVSVIVFFLRSSLEDARAVGELVGSIVTVLVLPTLVAMLVWRLSGRSRGALQAAFYLVFGLVVFGQVSNVLLNSAERRERYTKIQAAGEAAQAEQRAALARGEPVDRKKAEQFVTNVRQQFDDAAVNSTGREKILAEAGKDYMDQTLAAGRRYDAALQAIKDAEVWNLGKFRSVATAADLRVVVQEFADANAESGEVYSPNGSTLVQTMKAHGATQTEMDDAARGFRTRSGPRLVQIARIRKTDAQIAQAMMEFIDFAEANLGKWHVDRDGKIRFDQAAALAKYEDILARVRTFSVEQEKLKRQFATMK
ncbi:MAG: hypothetical protein JWM32_1150 [Verrucomicrobia bacterium]|nr:hypothetical protein [Verrucomicrobiota bacterium]